VHLICQSRVAGSGTKQGFFPALDFVTIVRNRLFLFGIGRFFDQKRPRNEGIETPKKQARYRKETINAALSA